MPAITERKRLLAATRAAGSSGTLASVFSAAALAICSKIEEGSAAGGLNGPSQWLWGEREAYTRRATLRHTAVGYTIHHATSLGWATLHERVFGQSPARKSAARHCAEAATSAAFAYIVDYHFTPSRFRPGFKKHLGPRSIFLVYAAFAGGLAAAAVLRSDSGEPAAGDSPPLG